MKAPVADAAGKDASRSRTTRDTHVPIIIQTVTRGRCRHVRLIISCRFATATMSNGRIANCYCLLRFANRWWNTRSATKAGVDACHECSPQSPWRPSERELGIRTIEERPGSSQFECCGEEAGSTWGRTKWRPNRGLLRFARVCKYATRRAFSSGTSPCVSWGYTPVAMTGLGRSDKL
jgi:hypothetical protein